MLNILVLIFVSCFLALAALGHILLIRAIWPDPFGTQREPELDPAADPARHLPLPN